MGGAYHPAEDEDPGRRGRGGDRRLPSTGSRIRRLRGHLGGRRRGGRGTGAEREVRPGAARCDASGSRWTRGPRLGSPFAPHTARDTAHGSWPRRGSRSRPRFGGDRLRDEAILVRGACGAGARPPSSVRAGPAHSARGRRHLDRPRAADGATRHGSRSASRRPSSTCLPSWRAIPTRSFHVSGSSRRSGATTSIPGRTSLACTSAICGGSSL